MARLELRCTNVEQYLTVDYKIVFLHILPFAQCSTSVPGCSSSLSRGELRQMSALRFEADRRRFVLTHAYARQVLGDCLGMPPDRVPLMRSATGQPRIGTDRPISFSLAHCETHAVVAIANQALVGVDVEHHRSVPDALAIGRRYFAGEEADMLVAREPQDLDAAFLRLWVSKEAFTKAIGLGLSYPLNRVVVRGFDDGNPRSTKIDEAHGKASEWSLTYLELARSYIAVAVKPLPAPAHMQ